MNHNIMRALGFNEHVNNAIQGKCPFCYEIVVHSDFKDEISRKEFSISGLCQKCQDQTFYEDMAEARDEDNYEDHYYPDEL